MNDSKLIAEQYLEAFRAHDFLTLEEMMHEDYTYETSDGNKITGKEAGMANARMLLDAYPDLTFETRNRIVSENYVVSELILHGTQKGIMPGNRTLSLPACNVIEIRDGKIYSEHDYLDNTLMMKQLEAEVGHEHA